MEQFYITRIEPQPHRDDINALLGRNVKRLRIEQGLTISGLSRICGISRPFLAKVEQGCADVKLSYVQRLADALCVGTAELFAPCPLETLAP